MPNCGCKKVVASGARTTVLMREERCFDIPNAEVADETQNLGTWKLTAVISESVVNEIGTLTSGDLNPQRAIKRRVQGASAVGGDLNIELANNGYAFMIAQAIGKIIGAGTSGDPYTILPVDSGGVASDATAGYQQDSDKYASDGAEITYAAACSACDGYESGVYTIAPYGLEPGFSLLISRDGGTIKNETGVDPTNIIWFQYLGCKINSWSVSASPTEIVTSTFSVLASEEERIDLATPSFSTRPEVNDPFSGFNADVTIDSDSLCVISAEFTLNNNLNADQRCLGQKKRNSLPESRREIEGTLTIEFADLIQYNKYINGTSSVLTIFFDLLGDATETMKVIFPKIEYNGTTPTAGGPEAINQELPFTAMWDDNPADGLLVKGADTVTPNGFDIAVEIVTAGALI